MALVKATGNAAGKRMPCWGISAVDFTAMTERDQVDDVPLQVEFVDDASVADAQPAFGAACESVMRILIKS